MWGCMRKKGIRRLSPKPEWSEERTFCGEVVFLLMSGPGHRGGSYLLSRLIEQVKDLGFKGIIAQVLADNQPMIKVFEKSGLPMESNLNSGIYYVKLNFKS